MSEQVKKTVYIASSFTHERVEVQVDTNGKIYNLAEEAKKKFSEYKTEYIGFELTYNGRYLQLDEPNSIIKDRNTVDIFFIRCPSEGDVDYCFLFDSGKIEEYYSISEQEQENMSISSNDLDKDENNEKRKDENENLHSNLDGEAIVVPLLKIIIGVIDLLLLAAAITTFLLFFLTSLISSIVIPIVLTVLFVIDTILFFGFNKILPKGWIGEIDCGTGFYEKDENETKNKNKYEPEQNNPEKDENQEEEKKKNKI